MVKIKNLESKLKEQRELDKKRQKLKDLGLQDLDQYEISTDEGQCQVAYAKNPRKINEDLLPPNKTKYMFLESQRLALGQRVARLKEIVKNAISNSSNLSCFDLVAEVDPEFAEGVRLLKTGSGIYTEPSAIGRRSRNDSFHRSPDLPQFGAVSISKDKATRN